MKQYMRWISAALLTSVLAGCGGGTPADTTSADAGTPDTAVTAPSETEPEYVDPGLNFNNADFKIYTWHPRTILNRIYFTDTYDGIDTEETTGDRVNDAIYNRNRLVEEQLGFKLEKVEYETYTKADAFTQSVMTGDKMFDVALGNFPFLQSINATSTGMIADLNDYGLDLEASWYNQAANEEFNIKGKQMYTTGDLCLYNTAALGALYFNKSMIDTFNLTSPYTYVKEGTWTLDAWQKMAQDVSGDIDGDGEHDLDDRYGISASGTVMGMLLYSCGQRISTKNSNNISELTLNTEGTQRMVEKGVAILRDEAITLFAGAGKYQGSGTSLFLPAFLDNRLLFHFTWVYGAYEMREMEADFGIVPFPKLDEEQQNYYCRLASAYATYLFSPITNDKVEMTAPVLDALGYYSKTMVTPEFIDSTVTSKLMRDSESAEMIELLIESRVYDLYDLYGWGKIGNIPGELAKNNSTDFASAYAKAVKEAQTALDETFK